MSKHNIKRRQFIALGVTAPIITGWSGNTPSEQQYHTGHPIDLKLPKDRDTLNAWYNSFYRLIPSVHEFVNKHVNAAIDASKGLEAHSFLIKNRVDIKTLYTQYFLFGDVFVGKGEIACYQPSMNDPQVKPQVKRDMSESRWVVDATSAHIRVNRSAIAGQPIVQAQGWGTGWVNSNIAHIASKPSPYDLRGASILFNHLEKIMRIESYPPESRKENYDKLFYCGPLYKEIIKQRADSAVFKIENYDWKSQ